MKKIIFLSAIVIITIVILSCTSKKRQEAKGLIADSAMVVSAHPIASKVGVSILKKGGNAVDAAIAVQFALAVVFPAAGNIGGGGYMVARMNNGSIAALDYREKAPARATTNMYLDKDSTVIPNLSTE